MSKKRLGINDRPNTQADSVSATPEPGETGTLSEPPLLTKREPGRTKLVEPRKLATKNRRNKGLRFPEMHVALGEVLRTYRSQKNVSQSDVSLDADIDRAYISRIERAEQSPTIATLIAIATKLGVPAWQLLKEAEEKINVKDV
jgi:ribosome-binding protein aMBF1 (putative translation factor)